MRLHVAWAFLVQHLKTHLEYRTNFLISFFGTAVWQTGCLVAVKVVLDRTPGLGGWAQTEIFLIYGLITLCTALNRTFAFNLFFFGGAYIRPGTFDRLLIRPINPLLHLLADRLSAEGVGDLVVGLVIVARSLSTLAMPMTLSRLAYLVVMVLAGSVVVLAMNLLTATLAFWIVEATPVMLTMNHNAQMARYPLEIYTKPVRLMLTWLIPYGLISYYPAGHLLGREMGLMAWAPIPLAAVALLLAYRFWLFGMRHYTGTGS